MEDGGSTVASLPALLGPVADGGASARADLGAAEAVVAATTGLLAQVSAEKVPDERAEPLVSALVGVIGTVETLINALTARRAALLAIAAHTVQAHPGTMIPLLPGADVTALDQDHARRALVAEVATLTGASELTTATRVETSVALTEGLPGVLTAMADGRLGEAHARHLVRHAEGLPAEALGTYEQDVLSRLRADRSPARVNALARAARERCHPTSLTERHERAAQDRAVHLDPAADGMAWLGALLPAVQAHAIFDKLTGIGHALRQCEGETRTLAQCRADALTALTLETTTPVVSSTAASAAGTGEGLDVTGSDVGSADCSADAGSTAGGHGAGVHDAGVHDAGVHDAGVHGAGAGTPDSPGEGGASGRDAWELDPALRSLRPTVAVTVPVMTLLGLSDEPGSLEGYGPIDPRTARLLAAHAPSFLRVLTHPETGAVLSVGRERYAVPADLRAWLRHRDGTCRFPGCPRPAARCEVDHTTPFREDGARGETDAANLAHLCRKHHRMKHTTRWRAELLPDAHLEWTSPLGRRHRTAPTHDMRHLGPPSRREGTGDHPTPVGRPGPDGDRRPGHRQSSADHEDAGGRRRSPDGQGSGGTSEANTGSADGADPPPF